MMFRSPFFPVPYQHLPNRPRVELVKRGELAIPGIRDHALPLQSSRRRARVSHSRGHRRFRLRDRSRVRRSGGTTSRSRSLRRGRPRSSWTRTSRRRSSRSIAGGATATGDAAPSSPPPTTSVASGSFITSRAEPTRSSSGSAPMRGASFPPPKPPSERRSALQLVARTRIEDRGPETRTLLERQPVLCEDRNPQSAGAVGGEERLLTDCGRPLRPTRDRTRRAGSASGHLVGGAGAVAAAAPR